MIFFLCSDALLHGQLHNVHFLVYDTETKSHWKKSAIFVLTVSFLLFHSVNYTCLKWHAFSLHKQPLSGKEYVLTEPHSQTITTQSGWLPVKVR